MCLAIPGKIISIDNSIADLKMGKVDFGGIIKNICIQWVDANLNDYVLAHAGVAIATVDEREALRTLQDIEEIGRALENETNS